MAAYARGQKQDVPAPRLCHGFDKCQQLPACAWHFFFLRHCSYSRMGDAPDDKDSRAQGGNPCLEQTLESYELCCLVETFPNNHKDLDDFKRTLKVRGGEGGLCRALQLRAAPPRVRLAACRCTCAHTRRRSSHSPDPAVCLPVCEDGDPGAHALADQQQGDAPQQAHRV
jgi:hypothetical protein